MTANYDKTFVEKMVLKFSQNHIKYLYDLKHYDLYVRLCLTSKPASGLLGVNMQVVQKAFKSRPFSLIGCVPILKQLNPPSSLFCSQWIWSERVQTV